ncbi:uncharacterized protein LOC143223914 [Tachypleus tridentatus]|uniref:uncharacterized protein LOC143223914 n=1 Tax=Tachypleus tridentatus TaxID=6853 RepID=UPI003FD2E6E4
MTSPFSRNRAWRDGTHTGFYIAPPTSVVIVDQNNKQLRNVIGPYREGSRIVLRCVTEGGKPLPAVTWWRRSVLIDDHYIQTDSDKVENQLFLDLSRQDVNMSLTCQASNTNLTSPKNVSVNIDMNWGVEGASKQPYLITYFLPEKLRKKNKKIKQKMELYKIV